MLSWTKNEILSNIVLGAVVLVCVTVGAYAGRQQAQHSFYIKRERMWYDIIIDMPEGVVVVTEDDWTVREWNRGAEQITGIQREGAVGRQFHSLEIFDKSMGNMHLRTASRGVAKRDWPVRASGKINSLQDGQIDVEVSIRRYFYLDRKFLVVLIIPSRE